MESYTDETEFETTFYNHIAEFLRRVIYISIGCLFFGLIGFLLSSKLVFILYRMIGLENVGAQISANLAFTEKILWGAVIALIAFHYLFLNNIYGYVAPGLYPHERRTFMIPLLWAEFAPFTALLFLSIYSLVINRLEQPSLLELGNIRAWLIRFYLITALSTFMLALPGQKRNLSLYAYGVLLVLIWLLPNHVFDTLIILLVELCVAVSIFDAIVLSIWSDDDVKSFIDQSY